MFINTIIDFIEMSMSNINSKRNNNSTRVNIVNTLDVLFKLQLCDIIRQSTEGHKPRVFVVEVPGKCGYLTTMAGI